MNITSQEMVQVAATQAAPRFDMYAAIHKGLRGMMADTLLALGRMDTGDELEVMQTSQRVFELLEFCSAHLGHENEFLHTAMEARVPGSSARIGHEHEEHVRHIDRLMQHAGALLKAALPQRPAAAHALYLELSAFIAENFVHMQVEETSHNAILWASYSDAELVDIHNALVGSIPPQEMMFTLRWMVPFMSPAERVAMLADMRAQAPAPAFQAVLDTVQPHLTGAEWAKLCGALGLAAVPGLACS